MHVVEARDLSRDLSHNIKSTITRYLSENEYIAKLTIGTDNSTDLDLVKHIINVHVPTTSPKPIETDYLLDLDFVYQSLY